MKVFGRMAVFPAIPQRIARLHDLAYNLWWTWNTEAQALFAIVDPQVWESSEHNAVRVLMEADAAQLERLAEAPDFLARYDAVLATFDAYMQAENTWYNGAFPDATKNTIAYFSAEFGLHESLPIYSGGLGILSGDHCKEASDLNLPFVGVGFLYPQGYFRQRITHEGKQEALYEKLHFSDVAARAATGPDGHEVVIGVELPGRTVYAKVWRIQVGRIPLFLMDTDVEPNGPNDRVLSARLYGGDHEMRIAQEMVLGIGGVRALRALGVDPKVWHMNEGHSAFLGLERSRELVNGLDVSFDVAREIAASNAIFTTHTPVAAGNDVFSYDLVDRYFGNFWPQLRLNQEQFHALAGQREGFSMTVLALRLSAQHNGVSRLHGEVSRQMWNDLWPEVDASEVPIGSITNGVHTATWLAPKMADLFAKYLGADWYDHLDVPERWDRITTAPDDELWRVHGELKTDLVAYARETLKRHRTRIGEGTASVEATGNILDPNALTLGFARRFATYKRATLLFRDSKRLAKLLSDPKRPVQIVFAGKAHPADQPGQDFIRKVYEYSRQPEFEGRIVFLEDYDIDMARHLVAGCDVWLNTPIRPHEASGTSGQKAGLNGLPNLSILDGWWEEGYNGKNGWAIGERRDYQDENTRDEADVAALYAILENDVIPLYYDRGRDGVPHGWLQVMKESIRTVAPQFSMRRMIKEYTEELYVPAMLLGGKTDADNYALARELADWQRFVYSAWPEVGLTAEGPREGQLGVRTPAEVTATVRLGKLRPQDVRVELVAGRDENGSLRDRHVIPMEPQDAKGDSADGTRRYVASLQPDTNGSLVYGVRVVPHHVGLRHPLDLGLARWA